MLFVRLFLTLIVLSYTIPSHTILSLLCVYPSLFTNECHSPSRVCIQSYLTRYKTYPIPSHRSQVHKAQRLQLHRAAYILLTAGGLTTIPDLKQIRMFVSSPPCNFVSITLPQYMTVYTAIQLHGISNLNGIFLTDCSCLTSPLRGMTSVLIPPTSTLIHHCTAYYPTPLSLVSLNRY